MVLEIKVNYYALTFWVGNLTSNNSTCHQKDKYNCKNNRYSYRKVWIISFLKFPKDWYFLFQLPKMWIILSQLPNVWIFLFQLPKNVKFSYFSYQKCEIFLFQFPKLGNFMLVTGVWFISFLVTKSFNFPTLITKGFSFLVFHLSKFLYYLLSYQKLDCDSAIEDLDNGRRL